jgi:ectoine hydroxylase-related dioxygenase (phytanoyl-CoA dioxygenase family)
LFGREGVIEAPPIAHDTLTARMRAGVQALARADWPPVFSWVYDEFWQVPRAAPLVDLFTGILGAGYRQTRYIWTHLVPGRRGAAGWRPHVDYAGADFRLTVWIALSDVTADSGCICVIPRHLVPERVVGRWYELTTLEKPDVMDILHASRPLPVRAGGVLAWDAGLMHWGSTRQSPGEARVSFVMEFAPATTDAAVTGPTLPADGPDLPTHAERLAMIARAIRLYHPSETRAIRYTGLSDRLLERFQQA